MKKGFIYMCNISKYIIILLFYAHLSFCSKNKKKYLYSVNDNNYTCDKNKILIYILFYSHQKSSNQTLYNYFSFEYCRKVCLLFLTINYLFYVIHTYIGTYTNTRTHIDTLTNVYINWTLNLLSRNICKWCVLI